MERPKYTIGVQSVVAKPGEPEHILQHRYLEVRILNAAGEDVWTYRPAFWDPENYESVVLPAIAHCLAQKWTAEVDRCQLLLAAQEQSVYEMRSC